MKSDGILTHARGVLKSRPIACFLLVAIQRHLHDCVIVFAFAIGAVVFVAGVPREIDSRGGTKVAAIGCRVHRQADAFECPAIFRQMGDVDENTSL